MRLEMVKRLRSFGLEANIVITSFNLAIPCLLSLSKDLIWQDDDYYTNG